MATFGDSRRWLIVKRYGMWTICPPRRDEDGNLLDPMPKGGGCHHTGAEALALFASLPPLRVDQLTEACRQYEWADKAGDRWFYSEGDWHWETPFLALPTYCYDEVEVAKTYPWAGPFARTTGPGVPA